MKHTKQNKITLGWLIYYIISILIVYIGAIIQRSEIALCISSVFGVMYSLLIEKEKRIAFIFGIINVSIYRIYIIKTTNVCRSCI